MHYNYKVIPAPRRVRKVKGVAGTPELFAHTLTEAINAMAHDGWEYLRSEAMVVEGPRGWFRAGQPAEHIVLVFRRALPRTTVAQLPEPVKQLEPDAAPQLPLRERPASGLLRRGPRPDEPEEREPAREPTPLRPPPRLGPANKS